MNENELRTYCLEHAGETLPAEAEALLSRDPELKKQVDRLIAVSRLISLKKYEQPEPACLHRCIQSVNERIQERREGGLMVQIREWFAFEPYAGRLAYTAAALVVCAVGIGLFLRGGAPQGVNVASQENPVVRPEIIPEPVEMKVETIAPAAVEQIAEVNREIPAFEKPLIVLRVDTNPQPSRGISFGSPETVPVSFDY